MSQSRDLVARKMEIQFRVTPPQGPFVTHWPAIAMQLDRNYLLITACFSQWFFFVPMRGINRHFPAVLKLLFWTFLLTKL